MQTLLIDDNPTVVFLTQRLFHHEGLQEDLTTFVSPIEGLSYLQQQVQTGMAPRVILLDLNMPLLSGWDVLDALKPLEDTLRSQCTIYILTSSLSPFDKTRAQQYPLVAGVLHKPLDRVMLQAIQAQVTASEN
jgi:CheY-like chemotaxis protein